MERLLCLSFVLSAPRPIIVPVFFSQFLLLERKKERDLFLCFSFLVFGIDHKQKAFAPAMCRSKLLSLLLQLPHPWFVWFCREIMMRIQCFPRFSNKHVLLRFSPRWRVFFFRNIFIFLFWPGLHFAEVCAAVWELKNSGNLFCVVWRIVGLKRNRSLKSQNWKRITNEYFI